MSCISNPIEIDFDNTYVGVLLSYLRDGSLPFPIALLNDEELFQFNRAVYYFKIAPLQNELLSYISFMDPGPEVNLLNHCITGGLTRLVEYNYTNGASSYNNGTLEGPADNSWQNNGCLVDQGDFPDKLMKSYRSNQNSGSTWSNGGADSSGVLVIDITCEIRPRRISRILIFQMISDGATSHLRFSYHIDLTSNPSYSADTWIAMHDDWITIGPAITIENPPGLAGHTVQCTHVFDLPQAIRTRFLKVEVKNDGRNGSPSYIELRQIKALSRKQGEVSFLSGE